MKYRFRNGTVQQAPLPWSNLNPCQPALLQPSRGPFSSRPSFSSVKIMKRSSASGATIWTCRSICSPTRQHQAAEDAGTHCRESRCEYGRGSEPPVLDQATHPERLVVQIEKLPSKQTSISLRRPRVCRHRGDRWSRTRGTLDARGFGAHRFWSILLRDILVEILHLVHERFGLLA